MASDDLLDRARMVELLEAVGRELAEADVPEQELIVVGGAYMALADRRSMSEDVDALGALTPALAAAAQRVAREYGLGERWLNSGPTPFWPAGLDRSSCREVLRAGRLRVLVPPPEFVFAMKLYSYRPKDFEDLSHLWRACRFPDREAAVAFYWEQYPNEPPDPYLVTLIDDIEARIERDGIAERTQSPWLFGWDDTQGIR